MGPDDLTRTAPSSVPSRPTSSGARFGPGDILGGRYRIISLLGKGGMGEVYRADDLTLEQPVALKLLPGAWSQNPDAIARFRNEVRVARQVSHPNVCRVYDLGEVEGLWFLSMEYVDGEDLGSLLRRIGRLPADKALEIARKLCAGLAAAHDKGILHRDLKPANVMLDRRGQVLLTDFGLAGLAGEIAANDITSGTPAYMAPEQLAGEEVTVRSDIYSLGLVLYEIFSGKLPFESDTLAGLQRARKETSPESLTNLVRDVDPAVERVILRCLQSKPSLRPASAIAVAAALPGGDPLAAALAAGETPSPEMVVAAGEGAGLAPWIALPMFVLILAGLAASAMLTVKRNGLEFAAPRYSPDVLREKARDLLPKLGYPADPYDDFAALDWYDSFFNWAGANDKPANWRSIFSQEPSVLRFSYRTSPGPMTASEFHTDLLTPGIVTGDDPPLTSAGMTYMQLDQHGHLMYFEARPPQRLEPSKDSAPPDWTTLFTAAGLDATKLQPTEPLWTWLATSDTRAAWTGEWPVSGRPMRVEAAALRGKPVGFFVSGPWSHPWRTTEPEAGYFTSWVFLLQLALLAAILVGAPLLARMNLLRGRGDRKGALRLAAFIFVVHIAIWACESHVIGSAGTLGMFLIAVCTSTFAAVLVWTAYLALEPYVRRNWPTTLISWTSLLSGRMSDPIVGRDVLTGMLAGMTLQVLGQIANGWFSTRPSLGSTDVLMGLRANIGVLLHQVPYAVRNCLFFLFLIFLLRVAVRNQWVAAAGFAVIFTALSARPGEHLLFNIAVGFVMQGVMAVVLLRWGLLAAVLCYWSANVMDIPITTHTSAWYHSYAVGVLILLAGLAAWALRTSMKGRRLFPRGLFT
jgi:serine/threonine-protein kinase